jgi:hypothetical protein
MALVMVHDLVLISSVVLNRPPFPVTIHQLTLIEAQFHIPKLKGFMIIVIIRMVREQAVFGL